MSLTPTEEALLARIKVPSENDPHRPEFPPGNPQFPATPTYQIEVPGFANVWLKDESTNPTGTHKDRMAWDIIVTYRDLLLAKKRGQQTKLLPQMSIISSGSAALAIQSMLGRYGLPTLKVLADQATSPDILEAMTNVGCEVYVADLGKRPLASHEILTLTNNPDGIDVTSNEALNPSTRFYDWLAYEILNLSPEYCFIPFGTGTLYENVLTINRSEVSTSHHDPRFKGKVSTLRTCHFLGATSDNPNTKAVKLYAPHLPFGHYDEQWIRLFKLAGYCGDQSGVQVIREEFLDAALAIAAHQGIEAEASGIAGLALLLQMKRSIPANAKIVIVNTGQTKTPALDPSE